MELEIKTTKKVEVKYLRVSADVRYWEDAEVNGLDDENGDMIPCRKQDAWCPLIDVDTGKIVDWENGKTASIHYKVCDAGIYLLLDKDHKELLTYEGYVPNCLQIDDNGYGDYIILTVDEYGFIDNWEADFDDLLDTDD